MYLSAAHMCLQDDWADPPTQWILIAWPVVYFIGVLELIEWLLKECKRE